MTEAREQTSGQGTRYEIASTIPRNVKGERIGTGVMLEKVGHGLFGESVSNAVMKALIRTGRIVEAPLGEAEHTKNHSDFGSDTEQSRNIEVSQLLQADKLQTERALEATRSALRSEATAQADQEKSQSQTRGEEAAQPTSSKEQKEPETETLFVGGRGGIPITVPKNYTSADVTRAMRALGEQYKDYVFSPSWTPQGLGVRGRDIWAALKKAWQAAAPPEAQH